MRLKQFQINAIDKLKQAFYELYQGGNNNTKLTFKSPTGSGKTIMIAEFLKQLCNDDARFDADIAFIWLSKGELATQSKNKLFDYYEGGSHLLDLHNLNDGLLKKHEIFFVNWEKVISKAKENRKLRTDGEANTSFDTFIVNTHAKNRTLIAIIDEAHLNLDTPLAQEIIAIINPRISIYVSATPKKIPNALDVEDKKDSFIHIKRDEVVAEGLIKESIKIMPREEIATEDINGKDLDILLLDLAFKKQQELETAYQNENININPLILIQIPNDEKKAPEQEGQKKIDICKQYFASKNIHPDDIATWLSDKKENLADIVKPYSTIKALIFKQAASTGWDCPRASILVSFREMKNPILTVQVFGRVLRMPEAKHYQNSVLNHAYCYTSYEKKEISYAINADGENKDKPYIARIKPNIKNINLESVFLGRTDYGDIGSSFQTTFIEVADKYFNITNNDILDNAIDKLEAKNFDTNATSIINKLIIDANITVYDDFIKQLKDADELEHESSYNDTRKFYELLLHKELTHQEEESKFNNVARSWKILKSAFNVWLKSYIPDETTRFKLISNDLDKDSNSVLKIVITEALRTYKPIRYAEIKRKAEKAREILPFKILPEYSYSDNYKECGINKYVLDKCYILENCSAVEKVFIQHLERQNDIDWWYKNADNGREAFGIEYINDKDINSVFYPDFIIKQGDKIGIFDTKDGITADIAKPKAEALQRYIASHSGTHTYKDNSGNLITQKQILWGGIVVLAENGIFKINDSKQYSINIDDFRILELKLEKI